MHKKVRRDQAGCERRIEVIVKMQKREKKSQGGSGLGGQGGCERRIEVIVKMQKKKKKKKKLGALSGGGGGGGGGGGVGDLSWDQGECER